MIALGSPARAQTAGPTQALDTAAFRKLETVLPFLRQRNAVDYAITTPAGIDEARYIRIGGIEQWITVRGENRRNPVLLLLHGLGCDHTTWLPVLAPLARNFTVIAPDLLGHGQSAKPRADYSVGGYANGMRDLLTVLGYDKVTVVGHSFGGGVAMQFAYQFPERTERLILVASGGLGPEVSPFIRAITTPGFHQLMGMLTLPGVLLRTICTPL